DRSGRLRPTLDTIRCRILLVALAGRVNRHPTRDDSVPSGRKPRAQRAAGTTSAIDTASARTPGVLLLLAKAIPHLGVDLLERQNLRGTAGLPQLYVCPVLEAGPMTARRQPKRFSLVGVHVITV